MHGLLEMNSELGRTVAVAETGADSFCSTAYFLVAGFTMYVVKFLLPVGLSTFHPYPDGGVKGALFVGCALFMVVALAVAVWSLRRGKVVFFGVAFFTLCLVLVLQFIPVGGRSWPTATPTSPISGLRSCSAVASIICCAEQRSTTGRWILLTAATGLILLPLTRSQADVWQNTSTLLRAG